ncbi:T7SS effector LXG polymorphic toxin [Sutcliffiella horikoshii]|uniref:T7SS effector LXG polymorphic toxin n=1 Tax=Sutcliffiella horikoshii TaxID=79883 RepID=UPI00384BD920
MMKVLDVSSLHEGIRRMTKQLSQLEKQLKGVENSIRSFVASKDSFRGKGANAIRRFYEYAHLPFLQFFQLSLANFQAKLQQLQFEMDGLEGDSRGYIDESFLSSELEDGFNQINRMVAELTGETNAQLSRVSDIVYLPRLKDHQFHEGIQHAKQSAKQTVDKLRQFDHQQTQSFTALVEDLSLIKGYIEEMNQQFESGKINVKSFSPVMLQDLEAYGKLQTRLYNQTVMQRWNSQHYPELGVFYSVGHAVSFEQWVNPSCARPEPKKKSAWEAMRDFTNGFGSGIIEAASDTWDGLKRLVTEPDQVLKETIEFLSAVVTDPAIVLEIGHELYNSFNESVIHGDANSRGEWLGYATTVLGTAVVGDKGLSRVGGTVGRLGARMETDLNIKLNEQKEKALNTPKRSYETGLNRVRELMGGMVPNVGMTFAGGPTNVINSAKVNSAIKEMNKNIITKIEVEAGTSNVNKSKGLETRGYQPNPAERAMTKDEWKEWNRQIRVDTNYPKPLINEKNYEGIKSNSKYFTAEGEINWPPNRGVLGEVESTILKPGTIIDRFGYEGGTFVSPYGVPYEMRALAPETYKKPYKVYVVKKPVEVHSGKIAPWFDEPGLGIQYELNESVKRLIEKDIIRRVGK